MSALTAKNKYPSDELADLLDISPSKKVATTEMVKKFWAYVKANDLQDPDDRRVILCNADMKSVFGKSKIKMTEVTKYLNQHLEKAD
jgi:chromatin remodeling complex protein RSC6